MDAFAPAYLHSSAEPNGLTCVYIFSTFSLIIGPTAIIALLIQKYVAENEELAVFLAFINGLFIFIFGLFNLGFLVQFISMPVKCVFLLCLIYFACVPLLLFSSSDCVACAFHRLRSLSALRRPPHSRLAAAKLNHCSA